MVVAASSQWVVSAANSPARVSVVKQSNKTPKTDGSESDVQSDSRDNGSSSSSSSVATDTDSPSYDSSAPRVAIA